MRENRELWELVDFDPVCQLLTSVAHTLNASYPQTIGQAAARLCRMVCEETYDRLAGQEGCHELQENIAL